MERGGSGRVEDGHGPGPAGRGTADPVRKAADGEAVRGQRLQLVQLLEMAVADVAPGLVALQIRALLPVSAMRWAVYEKGASQLQASVPVRRTPRSSRYMVAS